MISFAASNFRIIIWFISRIIIINRYFYNRRNTLYIIMFTRIYIINARAGLKSTTELAKRTVLQQNESVVSTLAM